MNAIAQPHTADAAHSALEPKGEAQHSAASVLVTQIQQAEALTKQIFDLRDKFGDLTDSLGVAEEMLRQSSYLFYHVYERLDSLNGAHLLPAGYLDEVMLICALGEREGNRWAKKIKEDIHEIAESEESTAEVA